MKKILFVDDEPNVILGLKRMLRPLRGEWQMEFVSSGAEALQILQNDNYDVVVSDMRMPEMDGADLLSKVMKNYPHIIRIILSGFSEQELIMKSVRPTHQFLTKPCDAENLKNTIHRACELHDMLESDKIKNIIMQIDSLPSLPSLFNQMINKLKDPDTSIKEIGDIIQRDVGMTTKILKLINSSYFGFSMTISDAAQAVSLLGLNTIKTLVLSMEVFSIFKPSAEIKFPFSSLWEHCTLTAMFAKAIAGKISKNIQFIEDAFTVGFLHDVGILILATKLPCEYSNILKQCEQENLPLWKIENRELGSNHTEIGAYLLGLWGFADNIIEGIVQHHNPVPRKDDPLSLVTIVHFADALSEKFRKTGNKIIWSKLNEKYLKELNLLEKGKIWIKICKESYNSGEF